MSVYFQVMGTLRTHTAQTAAWIPPAIRQVQGGCEDAQAGRRLARVFWGRKPEGAGE